MQAYQQQQQLQDPKNAQIGSVQQTNMYMMHTQEPGLSSSCSNLVAESTEEQYTVLYVLSVLASIFFHCIPCSFIGLMHIIAARADHSRGSLNLARKKRGQALCWTAWACGIGWTVLVIIIVVLALTGVAISSVFHMATSASTGEVISDSSSFSSGTNHWSNNFN